MNLINLTFHLGVIFAIFSFIWGILNFLFNLLRGGKVETVWGEYILKALQYLLLVNVVMLSCLDQNSLLVPSQLILTSLVLLLYFISKFQKRQQKSDMLSSMNEHIQNEINNAGVNMNLRIPGMKSRFNAAIEIIVILFSIALFILLSFYPHYAENTVAVWFYKRIVIFENLPLIGFIFKVVGFFFLLSILFKIVNGIGMLFTGQPFFVVRREFMNRNDFGGKDKARKDENDFDDYEEIK